MHNVLLAVHDIPSEFQVTAVFESTTILLGKTVWFCGMWKDSEQREIPLADFSTQLEKTISS